MSTDLCLTMSLWAGLAGAGVKGRAAAGRAGGGPQPWVMCWHWHRAARQNLGGCVRGRQAELAVGAASLPCSTQAPWAEWDGAPRAPGAPGHSYVLWRRGLGAPGMPLPLVPLGQQHAEQEGGSCMGWGLCGRWWCRRKGLQRGTATQPLRRAGTGSELSAAQAGTR